MTPSETLVAAADHIRDLAAAATDGPWRERFEHPPRLYGPFGALVCELKSPMADGRWIAALSPATAAPLEAILRRTASDYVVSVAAWESTPRADGAIERLVEQQFGGALALARLVLGEETS
jgi:hypothetical protein